MLQGIVTAAHSQVSLNQSASLQGSNDKQIARLSDPIENWVPVASETQRNAQSQGSRTHERSSRLVHSRTFQAHRLYQNQTHKPAGSLICRLGKPSTADGRVASVGLSPRVKSLSRNARDASACRRRSSAGAIESLAGSCLGMHSKCAQAAPPPPPFLLEARFTECREDYTHAGPRLDPMNMCFDW
jgi:hypothetical protein